MCPILEVMPICVNKIISFYFYSWTGEDNFVCGEVSDKKCRSLDYVWDTRVLNNADGGTIYLYPGNYCLFIFIFIVYFHSFKPLFPVDLHCLSLSPSRVFIFIIVYLSILSPYYF
jgi:hypothetical protein